MFTQVAEVHTCQNMVKTLSQAVADGWEVLGAVAEPRAIECRKFRLERPTIIVMGKDRLQRALRIVGWIRSILDLFPLSSLEGNEGVGLRTNVKRACSGFIKVEMGLIRQQLAADSLNVSVAAGILIHSVLGSPIATTHGR